MNTDREIEIGAPDASKPADSLERMKLLANLKTHWRNWKVRGTGKAYRTLAKAMRDDPGYAHSWMCSIAMPIYDGSKGKLTIHEANAIAEHLMRHLFGVTNTNPQ